MHPAHPHRHLDQVATLSELERQVIDQEWMAGVTPHGMVRPLFPWEVRSGANFAGIARTVTTAGEKTSTSLMDLRDVIVTALVAAISQYTDEDQVQRALTDFAATQPAEVRKAIADATDEIQATLEQLYADGADEVVREAVKQGVKPSAALLDGLDAAPGELAGVAAVAPTSVWSKLLDVAVKAGGARLIGGPAVTDLVIGASIDGAFDLARQAINIVHGDGRRAAADQLVSPSSVYASELLDGNTCDPCAEIDGYEYISLDEAYADYPDAGPYSKCDGGDRCRGTLLFIWGEDAATDPVDGPDA